MVIKLMILDKIMKGIIIDRSLRTESWTTSEFRNNKNKEEPGKVIEKRKTGV